MFTFFLAEFAFSVDRNRMFDIHCLLRKFSGHRSISGVPHLLEIELIFIPCLLD